MGSPSRDRDKDKDKDRDQLAGMNENGGRGIEKGGVTVTYFTIHQVFCSPYEVLGAATYSVPRSTRLVVVLERWQILKSWLNLLAVAAAQPL